MVEYIAYISCDTGFLNNLEGTYSVLKYTLEPCVIREENQHRGVANFTISFSFEGLPENGLAETEKLRNHSLNRELAIEKSKLFIAWLSVATRRPLELSHTRFGNVMGFGPFTHEPIDKFNRELMVKIFHIQKDILEGTYEKVKRPIYTRDRATRLLRIPHDFSKLTQKLYSLQEDEQEKFFDSCLSYQFAKINSVTLPSISLVALVNAVESLMRNRFSSGYCEDAKRRCVLKWDIMKKFRAFFEENLQYPLPAEKRRFINEVYSSRSNFVHKALMGSGPFRGPMYANFVEGMELKEQLWEFSSLVNACMINYLMRI